MLNIKIENIRCLSGEFQFYPGLNLIAGDNGTGKSTLANALFLALFGRFPQGNLKGKNLIKRGEKQGYIYVSFPYQDHIFEVERRLPGQGVIIRKDGEPFPKTDYFLPEQFKFIWVANEDFKFDFSYFFDIESFIKKGKVVIDRHTAICEKVFQDLIINKNMINVSEKNIASIKEELSQYKSSIEDIRKRIEILNKELSEINKEITEANDIDITDILNEKERIIMNINHINTMINNVNNKVKIKRLEMERSLTLEANEKLSLLQSKKYELENYLGKMEKIKNENICPLCLSTIDPEKILSEISQTKEAIDATNKEVNLILSERDDKLQKILGSLEQYEKEALQDLKQQLLQEKGHLNLIEEKVKILKEQKERLEKLQREREEKTITLEKLQERLANLVQTVEKKIKELKTTKDEVLNYKREAKKTEDHYEELKNKIDVLKNKIINNRFIKLFFINYLKEILDSIIQQYNFFKVKPIIILDEEKETIEIQAKNLNGLTVAPQELSQGESTLFKIYKNIIVRDLYKLFTKRAIPNIFIIDEMLDNLSLSNQQEVISLLNHIFFQNHIIILVTHRVDTLSAIESDSNLIILPT